MSRTLLWPEEDGPAYLQIRKEYPYTKGLWTLVWLPLSSGVLVVELQSASRATLESIALTRAEAKWATQENLTFLSERLFTSLPHVLNGNLQQFCTIVHARFHIEWGQQVVIGPPDPLELLADLKEPSWDVGTPPAV